MWKRCVCGGFMDNVGSPGGVVHTLLDAMSRERLEYLVGRVAGKCRLSTMWLELWENSGAIETWKCLDCGRLYVGVQGSSKEVLVYRLERVGMESWDEADHESEKEK